MIAPAGLSANIVAQLNAALGKVITSAEMNSALNKQGLEPQTSTAEEFAAFIRSETEKNSKLIKIAGAKSE